jgi:hypothetical protein
MRKITLLLLTALSTLAAHAQLNGDGYYRVQSSVQQRYVRVLDNRGSVNIQTTDADLAALCTQVDFENVVSDPGSIIYIKKMSTGYDLQSQGTGSYAIIQYEVNILDMDDGIYWCAASNGTMTKYLADEIITEFTSPARRKKGQLVTNVNPPSEYLDWKILPVKDAEGYYFGVQPDVHAGDSYYQTFYAVFPFTFLSGGMSAWYVKDIKESAGKVLIEEITGGVPASTPVIIKSSAQGASNNKLNIGAATSGSVTGNQLNGVYFCNPNAGEKHTNVVEFDPKTMRVLGTASDGSLAFVNNVDLKYIPANSAYITVSESAPDVLKVITEEIADAVTIKADDKTMVYGSNLPELTYTVTDGEAKGTPELSCEAGKTSPVGEYIINVTKGTLTNEEVTLIDGKLTITKAPLNITAKSYTIAQGDELPEFDAYYFGFKNDETSKVLTKQPTYYCSATSNSEPGDYVIEVSGAEAENYDITYENGVLTITEASAINTISTDAQQGIIYDLQGRKMNDNLLKKGIYIMNGRKYIVK